jgi:hypothetical protein
MVGTGGSTGRKKEGEVKKSHPNQREEMTPLRPVGLAIAAVVAGLSAGKATAGEAPRAPAPLEPATQEKTYVLDHTNHPSFEEDPDLVVGPSAPVAPFGDA